MRISTALVSCALVVITAALPSDHLGPGTALNSPTHVIKFKRNLFNGTTAHNLVASKHREYMLMSLRATSNKRDTAAAEDEEELLIQAADMERRLSLDHISLDQDFVAVSGVFPDAGFIDTLHKDNAVDYVEMNHIYKATFLLPEQNLMMTEDDTTLQKRSQASSPDWGLARIHHRERGDLDSYEYDETAGSGVHVFVLDSGVNIGHTDFEGRAKIEANFVPNEEGVDLGGHGTHVAGKIAGKVYGVAKSATIHSVKILNRSGDGTMSNLIKGISHVIQAATPGKSLINLSLSGPKSRLIDEAISKVVNDYNIPVFVSSGNSGTDACYFSPASNPDVFSVGATDINDKVPYYSDTGRCVKVYAPGSNIKSAWIGGDDQVKSLDGTSMANPHVVGIAATLLSNQTFASPKELYDAVVAKATSDLLTFTPAANEDMNNNRIAYNGPGNISFSTKKKIIMASSSSTSPAADAAAAAAAAAKASTRFSFQHFDQESDFGVEDENGERVRKRKRPGRKPNPPTLQERRAQNRAAQRAFREREQQRRQEKERENQLHLEELIRTRKRLAEVQYEANYLRGCVLLLCMTNLVERGSVPHIWTDTRVFPIPWVGMPPSPPNDNVNSVPAILKTVLGKNNQILDFQSSLMTARCTGWSLPSQIEQLLNGVDSFIPQESAAESSADPKTNTSPSILSTMQQHREQKRKEQLERMREEDSEDEDSLSASTGTESMVSNFTATKNVYGTITDTPTLKTPDDLTHMPPLQALHILRLQLKSSSILGDKTRISLTPTALQRLIPHDVRIDYTPGPSLRDRMILFQGFYDADECFELLSKKTMFIGGDPRDTRNWVPHPTFSEKFWFLSHQLVDHHSGECALIPEIIDAILASQRQKEEEIKKLQKEKEEREREKEEEVSSNARSTSTRSSAARRAPLSSVRSERSSNIRSLPLDL